MGEPAIDLDSLSDLVVAKLLARTVAAQPRQGEPATEKAWLTPEEYAARSGLSTGTIQRHAREGMPHKRFGRSIRIAPNEADDWNRRRHIEETARRSATIAARKGSIS